MANQDLFFFSSISSGTTVTPTISTDIEAYNGGRFLFYIDIVITSNGSWTSSKSGGLGVSYTPTTGNAGDTTVRITWTTNNGTMCRYVTITFTNSTAVCYFEGCQEGTVCTECTPL